MANDTAKAGLWLNPRRPLSPEGKCGWKRCLGHVPRQQGACRHRGDPMTHPELHYQACPFTAAGSRLQVSLEPSWLEPGCRLYLAVSSPLGAEVCFRLLTAP